MPARRKYPLIRSTWPRVLNHLNTPAKRVVVDARPFGKREYYKTIQEGKTRADQLSIQRANHGAEAISFTTEQRVEAVRAAALLKPFNQSLYDAAQFYANHLTAEGARHQSLLVSTCVDQYLVQRRADYDKGRLSRLSLYEITARLKQLKASFGDRHIEELDTKTMREWLDAYPVSDRTRVNIRLRASKWLNWAVEQGYLQTNPVAKIRFKVSEQEVTILSVDEVERLLRAAAQHPDVLIYVLLQSFQGFRPGEAAQMTFERITVESVHVTAPSSKSRRNRYVETNETFWRWASPHLNGEGPILKPNFQKRHKQVVQSAGVKLPVDVLRHCFGSYWLAVHHDAARLAHLMGNSETVIFAHYRRIIPRPQAERYWALAP